MPGIHHAVRETVREMLAGPDEIMLDIGANGELFVAKLRVLVAALLLMTTLANSVYGYSVGNTLMSLAVAVAINLFALVWLQLAYRHRRYEWLPFATSAFDVTAVTGLLLTAAAHQLPAALNSLGLWSAYGLVIMLTGMRCDPRSTLLAGGLAVLQYGFLVAFAFSVSPELLISIDYGTVTPAAQAIRLFVLACVTATAALLIFRVQRLVEMSGTDGLTRLPNRSWLLHRIPRLIEAAKEEGSSLTLALIDIDSFKRVNDEAGHRTGDRALRHVVETLQDLMEPRESLVRLGGQEFVMVLQQPVGSAWERMDAIRRQVAARPFEPGRGMDSMVLTISAGLASHPHDGDDVSSLLHRADRRLQIAKCEGRNRIVVRDS
ncbi:MAG: GGDEF domain-containing protein [Pseudomonadota bacterium]|nr:GGDEF domain-containing protein [Pseudomonadota bacterium]